MNELDDDIVRCGRNIRGMKCAEPYFAYCSRCGGRRCKGHVQLSLVPKRYTCGPNGCTSKRTRVE